jgi:hypothetical protein
MARVIKNQENWHRITIKGDRNGDVTLVGAGRNAYLSCHGGDEKHVSVSGSATLRKLAHAILRTVPAKK